jgi:hypothetical protein
MIQRLALLSLCLIVVIALLTTFSGAIDRQGTDRRSVGLAPDPAHNPQAIVQVYAARTYHLHGMVAVHSWISVKDKNAPIYTNYQVLGFRLKRVGTAIDIQDDFPDRRWYGAMPELLTQIEGEKAERAIAKIKEAVANYEYGDVYRAWPGPNSNTFISSIIRQVPELGVELPPHAIGKDWIRGGRSFAFSETGTGFQFSLYGLLGMTVGLGEGIEMNVLGLTFGVDFYRPAVKLPFIGRLGMKDAAVYAKEELRSVLETEIESSML